MYLNKSHNKTCYGHKNKNIILDVKHNMIDITAKDFNLKKNLENFSRELSLYTWI